MERTLFEVEYATDRNVFPDSVIADVELFYLGGLWETDDDLARTLITVLENELRTNVYLISWGER